MEFRLVFLSHKLHFSIDKVEIVTGVNSNIDEQTHFLMWDFDNIPLPLVQVSLEQTQKTFNLPIIRILSTGKPDGYHAYCFKACSFLLARTIIAATANVDLKYLAVGLARGYFTLRYSDVKGREFKPVMELPSSVKADIAYEDVNAFSKYTKRVD